MIHYNVCQYQFLYHINMLNFMMTGGGHFVACIRQYRDDWSRCGFRTEIQLSETYVCGHEISLDFEVSSATIQVIPLLTNTTVIVKECF